MKPSLLGRSAEEINLLLAALPGVRSFTARQIEDWIFARRAATFAAMSSLPARLREELEKGFRIDPFEGVSSEDASDGSTKALFGLDDGAMMEAVRIPDGDRVTYCLSSQAGCALDCSFCVTGRLGPGRNLSVAEIVGQYIVMSRGHHPEKANVVFMGMGEPTSNLDRVREAYLWLRRELPAKRITLSTVGVVSGIDAIAGWEDRPNLAVSISAGDDELRQRLMPIARVHDFDSLISALRRYPADHRRRITIEYVLIAGVNDHPDQAWKLARRLRDLPVKINLIPLNEDPVHLPGLRASAESSIERFCQEFVSRGFLVTVRRSRGRETSAACGQLRGREQSSRRRPREKK